MDNVGCYPVYCINLKERTDRKKDTKKQFVFAARIMIALLWMDM